MVFVLETGSGLPNANAYSPVSFVDQYLAQRNRDTENDWTTQLQARKEQAIVVATDYIDYAHGRLIKGERLRLDIPGRAAIGTLTIVTLPAINEITTIGSISYRHVDVLLQENDVLRGATPTEAAANLAQAVQSGGDGTLVHALTVQNYAVTASAETNVVSVQAQVDGVSGNDIVFTTNVTGATITGSGTLTSGLDRGPQRLIFPRRGLRGYDGMLIVGIPFKLKAATAEYSVRSLAAPLAPDLTVSATGAAIQRKREKAGPIEEETEYAEGAVPRIFRPYPAADALLDEYKRSTAGVIR